MAPPEPFRLQALPDTAWGNLAGQLHSDRASWEALRLTSRQSALRSADALQSIVVRDAAHLQTAVQAFQGGLQGLQANELGLNDAAARWLANQLGDAGAEALARGSRSIEVLEMDENNIGSGAAPTLAANRSLRYLSLAHNQLGNAGHRRRRLPLAHGNTVHRRFVLDRLRRGQVGRKRSRRHRLAERTRPEHE